MRTPARTRTIGAKRLGRGCRLRAIERLVPEHFNPARGVMMPRLWQIEVTDGLPCDLDETPFLSMAPSSSEAEQGLLGDLRAAGISGVVQIKREAA